MADKPRFEGERAKLGDLISPFTKRNKDVLCTDVYSVTNSRGFTPSEDYFSKEVFSKDLKTYRIVKQGMIAYNPSRINVGSIAIQDKLPEVVVSPLYIVFETDKSRLLPEYALGFLRSKPGLDQIAFQSIGTVRNNLKYDALCRITINLPSLDRQRACIDQLNRIASIIELLNRYIAELDALVKSRFVEMFGDPCDPGSSSAKSRIDSFCELRIGPFGSALHKEEYITGGHPLVNPSHIIGGAIRPDENLTIDDDKYESLAAYHLLPGDVVLGRRGEIGRCAVVKTDGLICGTGSMIIRPGQKVRSDYLQRVVSFPSFSHALEANAVGVTMKNLNAKIVGSAEVFLPDLEDQDAFISFISQVDKSRFVVLNEKISRIQLISRRIAHRFSR